MCVDYRGFFPDVSVVRLFVFLIVNASAEFCAHVSLSVVRGTFLCIQEFITKRVYSTSATAGGALALRRNRERL